MDMTPRQERIAMLRAWEGQLLAFDPNTLGSALDRNVEQLIGIATELHRLDDDRHARSLAAHVVGIVDAHYSPDNKLRVTATHELARLQAADRHHELAAKTLGDLAEAQAADSPHGERDPRSLTTAGLAVEQHVKAKSFHAVMTETERLIPLTLAVGGENDITLQTLRLARAEALLGASKHQIPEDARQWTLLTAEKLAAMAASRLEAVLGDTGQRKSLDAREAVARIVAAQGRREEAVKLYDSIVPAIKAEYGLTSRRHIEARRAQVALLAKIGAKKLRIKAGRLGERIGNSSFAATMAQRYEERIRANGGRPGPMPGRPKAGSGTKR